jgi:hypothetical protein
MGTVHAMTLFCSGISLCRKFKNIKNLHFGFKVVIKISSCNLQSIVSLPTTTNQPNKNLSVSDIQYFLLFPGMEKIAAIE